MVEVVSVSKDYGETRALESVTLSLPARGTIGLVGLNGSGKTTLLSILGGLVRPTYGEIKQPVGETAFLPEQSGFEPWLTCREIVGFAAALAGVERDAPPVLASLGLEREADRRFGALSKGTQQRAALAAVLVQRANLTLLDEPLSGVDPINRQLVIDEIRARGAESTVVFSSHRLDDVLSVCDLLLVLANGRLVFHGSRADLRNERPSQADFEVEVRADAARLAAALRECAWVTGVADEALTVRFGTGSAATAEQELPRVLSRLRLSLVSFRRVAPRLEDLLTDLLR